MGLETAIEAAGAEVSVLQAFSAEQDGMESYVEKHELKQTNVNPDARFKELTENKTLHVSVSRVERSGKEDENVVHAANSTLQILQKQNQISELLLQQQRSSQLPPREIPVF